jgi:hypothetical protein
MQTSGVLILYFILTMRTVFAASSLLTTNIYAKTHRIYEGYSLHGTAYSPMEHFIGVRGGGVDFELDGIHRERFMDLVNVVSNNCSEIASDWYAYETNEMVRFTTLSAVGYSGYNNYTNFVDKILTLAESDARTNYFESLDFIMGPYGTREESSIAVNYENGIISNLVVRFRNQSLKVSDTNNVKWCDKVLSGEWKRDYLDMKTSGAL